MGKIDFSDTQIAFESKSDKELKFMEFLFRMMSKQKLTNLASSVGLKFIKWGIPGARYFVEKTIFSHFCGGKSLEDSIITIKDLEKYEVATVLDYGAEGSEDEEDFDRTLNQTLKSIDFAATYPSVPVLSTKVTGIARTQLLKDYQKKRGNLELEELQEFNRAYERLDKICKAASEKGVGIMIDAEESPIQDSIDFLVEKMMEKHNQTKVVVYQTFQMYRRDKLDYLKKLLKDANDKGYLLGAKLVRGAYMEKERKWAKEGGYPSPIHTTKVDTDNAYDEGIRFCIENYQKIALCNASHNLRSSELMIELIEKGGLQKDHAHLNFCQLYGMSDYITYNLAKGGFNVAKYVPYGPVKEVIPYLIRRAEENTTVTGEIGREHQMILDELKRRRKK
ncbi:MAG: proline dehydrogenase [Saprospirales bacterium]|nr:MAG: proline dehydrogenase [Saprospirales bacterium]